MKCRHCSSHLMGSPSNQASGSTGQSGGVYPSYADLAVDLGHVCETCLAPIPLNESETQGQTFFDFFGLPPRAGIDLVALEKSYHQLSRALHPDRFTMAPAEARIASMNRMGRLNEAWEVLKDTRSRLQYLCSMVHSPGGVKQSQPGKELGGKGPSPRAPVLSDLAEEWFELQEKILEQGEEQGSNREGQNSASRLLADFDAKLISRRGVTSSALDQLIVRWDAILDSESLNSGANLSVADRVQSELQSLLYLESLQRDLRRLEAQVCRPSRLEKS